MKRKLAPINYSFTFAFSAKNYFRVVYNYFKFLICHKPERKFELFQRINRMHLKVIKVNYSHLKQSLISKRVEVYPSKTIEVRVMNNSYNLTIPEVLIYHIEQCQPIPGSSSILIDDVLYFDDIFPELIEKRYMVDPVLKIIKSNAFLGFYNFPTVHLEKVILLDSFYLSNYYHFMFDCLAKLVYLNEKKLYTDYSICIGEDILRTPALFQVLVKASQGREIFVLKKYQKYHCNYAVYIERANYLPPLLGPKENLLKQELYAIHPESIDYLKLTMEEIFPPINNHNYSKRVIISRGFTSELRINENEWFYELTKKFSFEIYHPEKMSFNHQIALFQNAQCVVASTGAALVNTIFMKSRSSLISINANARGFSQYRSIAINRGVNYYEPNSTIELLDLIEILFDHD